MKENYHSEILYLYYNIFSLYDSILLDVMVARNTGSMNEIMYHLIIWTGAGLVVYLAYNI